MASTLVFLKDFQKCLADFIHLIVAGFKYLLICSIHLNNTNF